jgi:hypothetical protein
VPLPQVIAVKFQRYLIISLLPVLLFAVTVRVTAQSSDQSLPTPVLANEVEGNIAPLDLGDSRLTRHFYAFEGKPGDLIINFNSRNLNGDMDVFTAITFRPLMKISIYANTVHPEVTKSFYLRAKQILILRVEARSPNDDAGTYRIRFSGAFAPFSGGIPVAETSEEKTEVAGNRPGTRRVSSVGATIAEPPPAKPEPTPTTENTDKPAEEKEAKTSPPRSARTRPPGSTARNPRRRTPPARTKPAPPKTETAKTETEEPKKATGEGEEKSAVTTPEKPATEEKPKAQEPSAPQPGARLIIEEKDGTRIDRPMSTVRRVIVESGVIVIVLKTGRIERILMSNVARMAIEP